MEQYILFSALTVMIYYPPPQEVKTEAETKDIPQQKDENNPENTLREVSVRRIEFPSFLVQSEQCIRYPAYAHIHINYYIT
jgi:hypothetical protein